MSNKRRHLFHLVNPSPWPFIVGLAVFLFVSGFAFFMHRITFGGIICLLGLFALSIGSYNWFRDITEEASYVGHHTLVVRRGLILGFLLFISSEVMLFFGFFWAFFHSSMCPSIIFVSEWPFDGINVISAGNFPLLNTVLLIISGVSITWAHRAFALVLI